MKIEWRRKMSSSIGATDTGQVICNSSGITPELDYELKPVRNEVINLLIGYMPGVARQLFNENNYQAKLGLWNESDTRKIHNAVVLSAEIEGKKLQASVIKYLKPYCDAARNEFYRPNAGINAFNKFHYAIQESLGGEGMENIMRLTLDKLNEDFKLNLSQDLKNEISVKFRDLCLFKMKCDKTS